MTLVPSVNYIPSEHNSVIECAIFTHDEKYHQSHDITDIVIVFSCLIGVFMTTSYDKLVPQNSQFSRSGLERQYSLLFL